MTELGRGGIFLDMNQHVQKSYICRERIDGRIKDICSRKNYQGFHYMHTIDNNWDTVTYICFIIISFPLEEFINGSLYNHFYLVTSRSLYVKIGKRTN